MNNPKITRRYSQALYDFSEELNVVETIYKDILYIKKIYDENPELKIVIESPIIFFDKKEKIFKSIFSDTISEVTYKFLRLIIQKRREPQIPGIINQYIQIYYENHNLKEAYITTAYPISDELVAEIKNLLEEDKKHTFIMHTQTNPQLIGGLILRIDDFRIDATILRKINQLKYEFSQNKYKAAF